MIIKVKQKHPRGQMGGRAWYKLISETSNELCPMVCTKDSTMAEVLLQNEIIAGSEAAAKFYAETKELMEQAELEGKTEVDLPPALECWDWKLGSLRDAVWEDDHTAKAVAEMFEAGPMRELVWQACSKVDLGLAQLHRDFWVAHGEGAIAAARRAVAAHERRQSLDSAISGSLMEKVS